MGNWDGYTDADMLRPGKDVHDIIVENSELSTSISNIVRAGWPQKIFNSRNFTLRDSDILHAGIGACGQSFGLLGLWGANGARGDHSNYTFENLFLDDWYSLASDGAGAARHPRLHLPQHLGARSASARRLHHCRPGQRRHSRQREVRPDSASRPAPTFPSRVTDGAAPVAFPAPTGPVAAFTVEPPFLAPGDQVTFTADDIPHAHYTWLFGDGTSPRSPACTHKFPDALGTALDGCNGAGRFRVLLHVETGDQKPRLVRSGHRRRCQVA